MIFFKFKNDLNDFFLNLKIISMIFFTIFYSLLNDF